MVSLRGLVQYPFGGGAKRLARSDPVVPPAAGARPGADSGSAVACGTNPEV